MKKYLLLFLLSGFAIQATACSNEHYADFDTPPHIKNDSIEALPFYPKKEGVTRLVTYNVGVFNKYIKNDYQLITNMMQEVKADAICLNELDSCTTRTDGVFQLQKFAVMMGGWNYTYGAAMPYKGGSYGEGIATSGKIVKQFSVVLPQGDGAEPRVLVVSELEDMVMATTHLDHKSQTAQLAQAQLVSSILKERYGNSGKPVFLGGDMNAYPDSQTITLLKEDWTLLTPPQSSFPSTNPKSCIDYIFQLNNGVVCEVIDAGVMSQFKAGDVSQASDHMPVMLDIKLPVRK